jgi:methionyl-tRNA formyltransferase
LADKEVIITAAKIMHEQGQPGSIKISNKELVVYCGKDALHIKKLKPAGKNEMTATSFLSGYGHLLA